MMDQLHESRSAARQRFDKISEIQDKLKLAGKELSELLNLGDLLEPDDVIKTSANLVAGGISPHVIAGWLAEMPQASGDPLMAWISQHLQEMSQANQKLAPIREQIRHDLGLAAMRHLAGDHMGAPARGGGSGGGPRTPAENPLLNPSPSPTPGNQLQ